MRIRILTTLALLTTISLAGCLEGNPPTNPPVDPNLFTNPDNPIPAEGQDGHDHTDPNQHRFAEAAELLDHLALRDPDWSNEVVVGAHTVDVAGNILVVGVRQLHGGLGRDGFHIIDISEPSNLQPLAFWDAGVSVKGDRTIALAPDGNTVFLGFEGGGVRPGVAAIDIRDPTNPVEAHFWDDPQDFGSHTVATGTIGGDTYVFSLAMGVNILRYDPNDGFTLEGKYVTQDQLAAADAIGMLAEDGGSSGRATTYALRSLYGHDMNYYHDPLTGKSLLLVAYAYDGAKILDITNPQAPALIGRFLPPEDTDHQHYTHSITAERLEDGRLIVVVGSETFENENQGIASPIWILDATATLAGLPLQNEPIHLSTWRNPGGTAAGNLGLSVHFFRQENGLLYLSHYHGGVWAIDLRTDTARAEPQHFGYIMPVPENPVPLPSDEDNPCCIGFDLDGIPMVFDVAVKDGIAYSADIIQGVTSLGFTLPT